MDFTLPPEVDEVRRQIRAFYKAGEPLEGRDMLLEVRYLFIRLRIGVRVGNVVDERRQVQGSPVVLWWAGSAPPSTTPCPWPVCKPWSTTCTSLKKPTPENAYLGMASQARLT